MGMMLLNLCFKERMFDNSIFAMTKVELSITVTIQHNRYTAPERMLHSSLSSLAQKLWQRSIKL